MEIVNTDELSLHPEALTTPKMVTEQYEALKEHIEVHGQLEPATVYRGRIIDGRHRWLVLQELGIETMKIEKIANNSTLQDIKDIVRGKETRRHESAAQLAITAYKYMVNSSDKITQADAAKQFGVNRKRVGEAKQIAVTYQRPDILELIFNGGKFNTGTTQVPFPTDSLGTILRWLMENGTVEGGKDKDIGITPRTELTEDEQVIVNKYMNALNRESLIVKEEVAKQAYAMVKGDE